MKFYFDMNLRAVSTQRADINDECVDVDCKFLCEVKDDRPYRPAVNIYVIKGKKIQELNSYIFSMEGKVLTPHVFKRDYVRGAR